MTDKRHDEHLARDLAEVIHSAYAQQARGSLHPQHEQTLLARLAEALMPALGGTVEQAVAAANRALSDFEQAMPGVQGPRIGDLDRERRTVTLVVDTSS